MYIPNNLGLSKNCWFWLFDLQWFFKKNPSGLFGLYQSWTTKWKAIWWQNRCLVCWEHCLLITDRKFSIWTAHKRELNEKRRRIRKRFPRHKFPWKLPSFWRRKKLHLETLKEGPNWETINERCAKAYFHIKI